MPRHQYISHLLHIRDSICDIVVSVLEATGSNDDLSFDEGELEVGDGALIVGDGVVKGEKLVGVLLDEIDVVLTEKDKTAGTSAVPISGDVGQ